MTSFIATDEQAAILNHNCQECARILAGPGTGKSATIVALIDKLLSVRQPPKAKLLTFTRAATGELAKNVSEHPSAAAERPSTIHSFAISILLRNRGAGSLPEPLRIADDWEDRKIVRATLARRADVTQSEISRLLTEMAANWESLTPEVDERVDDETRSRFMGVWQEHRRIYGYTLLAEVPYALRHALTNHPDLEGIDFDLMLVDEYQDLNACDLVVIKMIGDRGCTVIAAGDDDQSIYSFRRAAPEGIRRFPSDYMGSTSYPLSVTLRCGSNIIRWASLVIEGDPSRPRKPRLNPAAGSPAGTVALLAFSNEAEEARGIADLIQTLVEQEEIPPSEILVLLRDDHNGMFSTAIKVELQNVGVPFSDSDMVRRILDDPSNGRILEMFRLLVHREDSIAWGSLLHLTQGIGSAFLDYIYERALEQRVTFGAALLSAFSEDFLDAPRAAANRARALIQAVMNWIDGHSLPEENDDPDFRWGQWMLEASGIDPLPQPSSEFTALLSSLDGIIEEGQSLGRYLGQITPLGKDLALAESEGIRIMTMGGAKGLTVQATIVAALEDGIVPRPDADLSEERRLLYVAMTRAKKYLFGTWRKGAVAQLRERARQTSLFVDNPQTF